MTRRGSRRRRTAGVIRQLPWQTLASPFAPLEILSADEVEAIVDASLTILETTGFRYLDDRCRSLLESEGASTSDDNMTRLDRDLVLEKLALAPASFPLRARNRNRDLVIGDNNIVFCAVGGPAFVNDLDRGRRPGTYDEMCDYLKLIQSLNIIHQEGGGCFVPMDLPPETRHLDLYLAQHTLMDKNAQADPMGRYRTVDCLEMTAIAHGISRDELAEIPTVVGIVNTNSPMQLDVPMSEAVQELAQANQATCITPFTLAGSMSPATQAGTLAQQTAEVLAVVAAAQTIRPGAPVIYGAFASNVDMQSGAPALGTPEYTKMAIASGQIARRLGLPLRSSSTTTANSVDAQSAYESQMSLWGAIMGHANLIVHAGGWLETGLTASFEKLIVDAEMLQMMAETMKPIVVNEEELALSTIDDVPPGGHHFGTPHTLERYESAFYAPMLSSRLNFETWQEQGSIDVERRANAIWKQLLAEYEKPPIDPAIEEALNDYVDRRKDEIKCDQH